MSLVAQSRKAVHTGLISPKLFTGTTVPGKLDLMTVPNAVEPSYQNLLDVLSEGSVRRRFDPYLDIAWDSPDMAIDLHDPRWVLSPVIDPLGATEWYQNQPLERQIEIASQKAGLDAHEKGISLERFEVVRHEV